MGRSTYWWSKGRISSGDWTFGITSFTTIINVDVMLDANHYRNHSAVGSNICWMQGLQIYVQHGLPWAEFGETYIHRRSS